MKQSFKPTSQQCKTYGLSKPTWRQLKSFYVITRYERKQPKQWYVKYSEHVRSEMFQYTW